MLIGVAMVGDAQSQSAFDQITKDWRFSASNYCIYPDTQLAKQTPAPMGKVPFYISHYGRHGSRYLSQRKAYLQPYKTLQKADSLGKLTPVGKDVMRQMALIINESEGRWGDLSPLGTQQHRGIATRMVRRYPSLFSRISSIEANSTNLERTMLSMLNFTQAVLSEAPAAQIHANASRVIWGASTSTRWKIQAPPRKTYSGRKAPGYGVQLTSNILPVSSIRSRSAAACSRIMHICRASAPPWISNWTSVTWR